MCLVPPFPSCHFIATCSCIATCVPIPFFAASRFGHLPVVVWLVESEGCSASDKAQNGVTPVHLAAAKGSINCLRWLTQNDQMYELCCVHYSFTHLLPYTCTCKFHVVWVSLQYSNCHAISVCKVIIFADV